jgi:hypothetical protein
MGTLAEGVAYLDHMQGSRKDLSRALVTSLDSPAPKTRVITVSLDWFKGKFTGNHGFYHVNFPIIQFYDSNKR